MINSRTVANNVLSTDVSITFHVEDEFGKTNKFMKTLTNIKDTASYEEIYNAASSIAKLYDHDAYDVKLITTNLLQKDFTDELAEKDIQTTEIPQTLEEPVTEN